MPAFAWPPLIVFKAIANRPKEQIDLLGLLQLPGLDDAYIDAVEAVIARVRGMAQ